MAEILGILGFLISFALLVIKGWEVFFRKSRFDAYLAWAQSNGDNILEFNIANVGSKKDSIRSVVFRTPFRRVPDPYDRRWNHWEVGGTTWDVFPLVLDVDEVTPRIELPLSVLTGFLAGLERELRQGTAELLVTNARSKETAFPIPRPGTGPPTPTPEDLRG